MGKEKKQLNSREQEIEANKKYIREKIDRIRELTGEDLNLTEEDIEVRAKDPSLSIEKSNFFNRNDFKSKEQIEALYNNFEEYELYKNAYQIVYTREYIQEVEKEKAINNLMNDIAKSSDPEETKIKNAIEKRLQKCEKNIAAYLADDNLEGDKYVELMTNELIEFRILADAKNGKITLKDRDLTDSAIKELVLSRSKEYTGISKMVENSSTDEIERYVQKHNPLSQKATEKELDITINDIKGQVFDTIDSKKFDKDAYQKTKRNLIKLFILDSARKGDTQLSKREITDDALELRVSQIEKDYPEFDWMLTKGGQSSIRHYLDNPYEGLNEIVENNRDGIDLVEVELAKVKSEEEAFYKQDFTQRKSQISDWLQKRGDEMAIKFSKEKKKEDKDLAKIIVVQGLKKKVEDGAINRAELEAILNPEVIDKNAERLAKDPDFKTVSKTHLKNDYNALKSGKLFEAMVQEKKKTIDKQNVALENEKVKSVKKYNIAVQKYNESYFNSKEGRLEQKFTVFNKLNTVREKEAFIEREFGFHDLKHVDRFDPKVRTKLDKAQKFITSANARKFIETPPEKREDFLKMIGGGESYSNAVVQEAKTIQQKREARVQTFNKKHQIVNVTKQNQEPYLGL